MRKRIYQLPRRKWVQNSLTGLWHSRERTKDEIEFSLQAISSMTFVHPSEISWNKQYHRFTMYMP